MQSTKESDETNDEKSEKGKLKSKISTNYFSENNSHLIIEFNKGKADETIITSVQNKLESEKFVIIRRGNRIYLTADELALLFEAELNNLVKYNPKEQRFKRFKLEDYCELNALSLENANESMLDVLSKILTRNEKIKIAQQMIENNIQVSKAVFLTSVGKLYPGKRILF